MASGRRILALYLLLLTLVAAHIGLWFHSRTIRERWLNVPPAPGPASIKSLGLGDGQLAYRSMGIMLQNLGNTAGLSTPLKDYNYDFLAAWFDLADRLDPKSNFMPTLASFYFGATQNPKQLPPLIAYLEKVGLRNKGEQWRWLLQATYLARFREGNMTRALALAKELAAEWQPGRPLLLKEMPAFVLNAAGDKKSAYALMLVTLQAEQGKVPQAELNNTIIFMCTRTLSVAEASSNPVCKTVPQAWLKVTVAP